jgi:hypothetical protein
VIKDGVRKIVNDRQLALQNLVHAKLPRAELEHTVNWHFSLDGL